MDLLSNNDFSQNYIDIAHDFKHLAPVSLRKDE